METPQPRITQEDKTSPFRNDLDPDYVPPQTGKGEKDATPASGDQSKTVPLAALEDERKKRQAIESEFNDFRTRHTQPLQPQQPQQPQPEIVEPPDPLDDPEGYKNYVRAVAQAETANTRLAISVEVARSQHADYDQMEAAFVEAAAANPALAHTIRNHPAPAFYAYKEGKAFLARKELGDDPAKYREKLMSEMKDELRSAVIADLQNEGIIPRGQGFTPRQQQPAAQPRFPTSLATERSAAPRGNPGFSGPTPLSAIPGPGTSAQRRAARLNGQA